MLSPLPAYILAGGKSSRFGSDKAVFQFQGVPLWRRVANALEGAGCTVHLVGRTVRSLPIPELMEPARADHHPLWGVHCAAEHAQKQGQRTILVAPCDLGDLSAAAVGALAAASAASGGACTFAAGQPLLAILSVESALLSGPFASAGRAVRAFHEHCGSLTVDVGTLTNVNERPSGDGSAAR